MKTTYKLILYSIIILIISTIGITYWYISDHLDYNPIDFKFYKVSDITFLSFIDIIIQIGLVGGIFLVFSFLTIYFLKIKVKNIGLFSFLIIIYITLAVIVAYQFILYTIFHDFNNPIIFR